MTRYTPMTSEKLEIIREWKKKIKEHFGIEDPSQDLYKDFSEEEKKKLKKKLRELQIKFHPDKVGSDGVEIGKITEAWNWFTEKVETSTTSDYECTGICGSKTKHQDDLFVITDSDLKKGKCFGCVNSNSSNIAKKNIENKMRKKGWNLDIVDKSDEWKKYLVDNGISSGDWREYISNNAHDKTLTTKINEKSDKLSNLIDSCTIDFKETPEIKREIENLKNILKEVKANPRAEKSFNLLQAFVKSTAYERHIAWDLNIEAQNIYNDLAKKWNRNINDAADEYIERLLTSGVGIKEPGKVILKSSHRNDKYFVRWLLGKDWKKNLREAEKIAELEDLEKKIDDKIICYYAAGSGSDLKKLWDKQFEACKEILKTLHILETDERKLEVKIEELNPENQNFESEINSADSIDKVVNIKNRVYFDALAKSQAKNKNYKGPGFPGPNGPLPPRPKRPKGPKVPGDDDGEDDPGTPDAPDKRKRILETLKKFAIEEIQEKLEETQVKNEELSNPNWEKEINSAQNIEGVNKIKNLTLANISQIREKKETVEALDSLISEAKKAAEIKDYKKLKILLLEIKKYQGTTFYSDREAIIEQLYKLLSDNSIVDSREVAIESLNNLLKDGEISVDVSELDAEDQDFVKKIEETNDPAEIRKIQVQVADKIVGKRTEKVFNNLVKEIKNVNSQTDPKKIDELCQKIYSLRNSPHKWDKHFYEKYKPKLEQFLLARVNGDPQPSEVPKRKLDENLPIYAAIGFLVIVSFILIVVVLQRVNVRGRRR